MKLARWMWAIEARWTDGTGYLLGLGWFDWPPAALTHLMGNRTALFATRREARAARGVIYGPYRPQCHVVRVRQTLQTGVTP